MSTVLGGDAEQSGSSLDQATSSGQRGTSAQRPDARISHLQASSSTARRTSVAPLYRTTPSPPAGPVHRTPRARASTRLQPRVPRQRARLTTDEPAGHVPARPGGPARARPPPAATAAPTHPMPRHFAAARTLGASAGTASMLLATAFVLAACSADFAPSAVTATATDSTATQSTPVDGARWSDASTWPNGVVPGRGADVVIPAGKRVVLDGSTAPLRTLTVMGELTAAGRDVRLTAAKIDVMGKFDVGSAATPFTGRLVVTLTEGSPAGDAFNKGIMVHSGGDLELFGEHRLTWTHLGATAQPGATSITLDTTPGWRAGDRIVLASSTTDQNEAEAATVRAADGATLQLDRALAHQHWGTVQQIAGVTLDERAEVGLLTHNIVVQGDSASEIAGHGGHIMVMRGGTAHVDGIELYRMGQHAVLARYPFHWHMAGSVAGQFITSSSIWHTFNRCVTVHGSHDAVVNDDVCYDHEGHGYFLEDGIEHGNTFRGDLGLVARKGAVIPSDVSPATFWITNPDNTYENDVSAGTPQFGFWIAPPLHPTGYSATDAVWPQSTPLRRFDSNVAHSDGRGFQIEGDAAVSGSYAIDYRPRVGGDPAAEPATAVYSNLLAYRNELGFWARGDHQRIEGSVFADNSRSVQIGDAALVSNSELVSSTVIGASREMLPVFPMIGVMVYDGPLSVRDVVFANFPARVSGAFGTEPGFGGRVSPASDASGIRLVDAQPYIVGFQPTADGDRMTTLRDLDGSLTGSAGSTVVSEAPLFQPAGCVDHAVWHAQVCPGSFVRVGLFDTRDVCPASIRSDDGSAAQPVDCSSSLITFVAPTGHEYTTSQDSVTGNVNVLADGLPAGEWVAMDAPWPGPTANVYRFENGVWTALPVVSSRDALARQPTTAAYVDSAARRIHVRFVGRPGANLERVAVRDGSFVAP